MPRTFFAICRIGAENVVRRIPIRAAVQNELEQLFDAQEATFLAGRDEEVVFDGDWKPDGNQLLVVNDPDLASLFSAIAKLSHVPRAPLKFKSVSIFIRVKHEIAE